MNHADLYQLRETYNEKRIVLCFNGPFSHGLIVEIGNALKRYMQTESVSSSSALDVFTAYIEITQNIQQYAMAKGYNDKNASATVVISRDAEGRYEIIAGNVVEIADSDPLINRIETLSKMDKQELKSAYREQLRRPREASGGAGLGLIDIARKSSAPLSCSLQSIDSDAKRFFSLRVII